MPYRRIVIVLVAAALVIDVAWWQLRPLMNDQLEITVLDVGQGESMLVRFPGGKAMLIDGGGLPRSAFDVGEHVVAPALLSKGIHRLDWLMLSHPHHDHYRGLAAVAERFHPDVLWTNGYAPPEQEAELWDDFAGRVTAAGVDVRTVDASFSAIDIDGVKLEVLYPSGTLLGDVDLNDTSIVMRLTYRDISILFTGDLMEEGEQALLEQSGDLSATVLKVGHHGSDTSTTPAFLQRVQPKVAVMSIGQYNSYGMPDDVVVDRLSDVGATIYRTDLHGAITLTTDGKDINVHTFVR